MSVGEVLILYIYSISCVVNRFLSFSFFLKLLFNFSLSFFHYLLLFLIIASFITSLVIHIIPSLLLYITLSLLPLFSLFFHYFCLFSLLSTNLPHNTFHIDTFQSLVASLNASLIVLTICCYASRGRLTATPICL